MVHRKNWVVASSADLVWSIHHTASLLSHEGHRMFMVGRVSALSSSITLSDALLPDGFLRTSCFLALSPPPLTCLPHFGQAAVSPEPERRRAPQSGQNRRVDHLRADLTSPASSLEYSAADAAAS